MCVLRRYALRCTFKISRKYREALSVLVWTRNEACSVSPNPGISRPCTIFSSAPPVPQKSKHSSGIHTPKNSMRALTPCNTCMRLLAAHACTHKQHMHAPLCRTCMQTLAAHGCSHSIMPYSRMKQITTIESCCLGICHRHPHAAHAGRPHVAKHAPT